MPNELPSTSIPTTRDRTSVKDLIKPPKAPTSRESDGDVYQFLRGLREFAPVSDNELKTLANSCRFEAISPGQLIIVEGDEESLYGFIVVSGVFAMLKNSPNGKELIVELLQSNDVFGVLLTLAADRLPAQLSARSLQKSMVCWVPIKSLTQLLTVQPILFKEFVAHLLLCLHSSYGLSRGLAHDRVYVRIAAILSSLALKIKRETPSNNPYTVKFTRQQLADLTGTTAETAIRLTRAMQDDGLIDIKRPGMIQILNMSALQEIIET